MITPALKIADTVGYRPRREGAFTLRRIASFLKSEGTANRRPTQSKGAFDLCTRKAYELSQSHTARNAGRRWFYAAPQSWEQTGSRFGDAIDSRIVKGHYKSDWMESQITRMDITGTGCTQKNTDRLTHELSLPVRFDFNAGLPTASDSQGGPHGQPEGPPALPHIPIIDLKLRLVTVGPAGRARRARPRNP